MMKHKNIYRCGFTLVELLTVIAILAVLAAIILPVLALSRRAARQTTCTTQLRQLGQAVMMYNQEYEVNFPPSVDSIVRSGLVNDARLWICPLDETGGWGTLCAQNPIRSDDFIYNFEEPVAKTSYSYFRYSYTEEQAEDAINNSGVSLFVCQQHGKARYDYRHPGYFGASELVYTGKVLRLWSDGSINIKQINTEPNANGQSSLDYGDLFE